MKISFLPSGCATSKKKTFRLILSGFSSPYANMAIDEVLLESFCSGRCAPTLRIYGWNPAAFSLGYFQDPEVNLCLKACKSKGVPFVRRITGGGVLFHCQDISYSVVCEPSDLAAEGPYEHSFKLLCRFLLLMYRQLRLEADYAINAANIYFKPARPSQKQADFCFASNQKYDIVINGKKIGGNAQKRRRQALLQHGSIPLQNTLEYAQSLLREDISFAGLRVCSLGEALSRSVEFKEIERRLCQAFEQAFDCKLEENKLSLWEQDMVKHLLCEKYETEFWNMEAGCARKQYQKQA